MKQKKSLKNKKLSFAPSSLSEGQFGVILEDINSKFDILVEGHGVLDKKIDRFYEELSGEITELRGEFIGFRGEMYDFKTEMYEFKEEMIGFKEEMIGFKEEMIGFKEEMTGFKEEMIGFKEEMIGFKEETQSNFKSIFAFLSRIDDELKDIRNEINELKIILHQKADLNRLLELEKRVKHIEAILVRSAQ